LYVKYVDSVTAVFYMVMGVIVKQRFKSWENYFVKNFNAIDEWAAEAMMEISRDDESRTRGGEGAERACPLADQHL
jgi:hypothetical protein